MLLEGRAHRFGDNVSTDDIIAGKYKYQTMHLGELAAHLMENIRPDFRAVVRPGDFLVGGENFGCGSSREQAPQIIKHVGVRAVVARSFARIFFRNAINIGLLLVTGDTSAIADGDLLIYDPHGRQLRVPGRGLTITTPSLPTEIAAIIAAGGLLPFVRQNGGL